MGDRTLESKRVPSCEQIFTISGSDKTVKPGDTISFNEASNTSTMVGTAKYIDQLGMVAEVDGVHYELRKLMNIKLGDTLPPSSNQFLIEHANNIAKRDFMDFPEYEDGSIDDVATALTVIIQSTIDPSTEFNEAEMYDHLSKLVALNQG